MSKKINKNPETVNVGETKLVFGKVRRDTLSYETAPTALFGA